MAKKKKLSIIIPYFNTWQYTKPLLEKLTHQLTPETELILIDDGCKESKFDEFEGITVIHLPENVGVSGARNEGLNRANGDYITFIDSDDDVEECYVNKILDKINSEKFDICALGWKVGNWHNYRYIGKGFTDPVFGYIYKRDFIGETRFILDRTVAEDKPFNDEMKSKDGVSTTLKEFIYTYFRNRPGSVSQMLSKREG